MLWCSILFMFYCESFLTEIKHCVILELFLVCEFTLHNVWHLFFSLGLQQKSIHFYLSLFLFPCVSLSPECVLHLSPVSLSVLLWLLPAGMHSPPPNIDHVKNIHVVLEFTFCLHCGSFYFFLLPSLPATV